MTTPDTWDTRRQAASDAVWHAWHRRDPLPSDSEPMRRIMRCLADELRGPVDEMIDATALDFDDATRTRVLALAISGTVRGIMFAISEAVATTAAMPAPLPFAPPPAGAWVRIRAVGWQHAPEPRWDGMWHMFSGDWKVSDPRTHEVRGRARCGARLTLRSAPMFAGNGTHEAVVADLMPGVDACGKCRRIAAGGSEA